jgi:hypothetical protein
MAHKSLVWVDIGMVVLVGGYLAIIAFFLDEGFLVPLLLAFMAGTVVWALVAERAAVGAVERSPALLRESAAAGKNPLPH